MRPLFPQDFHDFVDDMESEARRDGHTRLLGGVTSNAARTMAREHEFHH